MFELIYLFLFVFNSLTEHAWHILVLYKFQKGFLTLDPFTLFLIRWRSTHDTSWYFINCKKVFALWTRSQLTLNLSFTLLQKFNEEFRSSAALYHGMENQTIELMKEISKKKEDVHEASVTGTFRKLNVDWMELFRKTMCMKPLLMAVHRLPVDWSKI